jgi:putative transposase
VAYIHERMAWRRGDFAHQHSRRLVNTFDLIAVEDLSVKRMLHQPGPAKRSAEAVWPKFAECLAHKAAGPGRRFVAETPAYAAQECSRCGHRPPLSLSDRTSPCPCCGLILDRALNAARNILRLAPEVLG